MGSLRFPLKLSIAHLDKQGWEDTQGVADMGRSLGKLLQEVVAVTGVPRCRKGL